MRRLKGLDALRGIAALIVLSYHVAAVFNLNGQPNGHLAVDFFFMLSGFVISGVLANGDRSAVEFLRWRYRRFWLTMAAGTSLGLLMASPSEWWQALPGLLLVPIFSGPFAFPLNPPTWSIFFELFANAVHSVLRRFWPAVFLVSLALLCLSGGFGGGPNSDTFIRGFPRVLLSYSLGVMLFQKWADTGFPLKVPALAGLALLLLLLPWRSPLFDFTFVMLVCPFIIMSGVEASLPFADKLGALSFPLYAVHFPVLLAAKSFGASPVASAGAAIAAAWLIAWLMPMCARRTKQALAATRNLLPGRSLDSSVLDSRPAALDS